MLMSIDDLTGYDVVQLDGEMGSIRGLYLTRGRGTCNTSFWIRVYCCGRKVIVFPSFEPVGSRREKVACVTE